MKRFAAGVLTVGVMGLLIWLNFRPGSGPSPEQAEAEEAPETVPDPYAGAEARIRSLLDSAREGDVTAYLEAFDMPIRTRLEQEVRDKGRDAFADELRRAARTRKSHAIFAPEPDGPDAARVTVETVYPDHNERQTFRLDRRDDGWLVAEVDSARGHQPEAKFGAPATFEAPEGVPVQGGTGATAVNNSEGTERSDPSR